MADKKQLSEFARRAAQRLKDKAVPKKMTLEVYFDDDEEPELYTLRNLADDEVLEVLSMKDEDDPNRADKYAVYLASVDPDLRAAATELKEAGEITEYLEIMDSFPLRNISGMAQKLMEHSGVLGGKPVTIVGKGLETLKN